MLFSIIIPAPSINHYLLECLKAISKQTLTDYEIILVLDKLSLPACAGRRGIPSKVGGNEAISAISKKIKVIQSSAGPAEKRDLGAKIASGQYLAFLDDDSYPSQNWLKNCLPALNNSKIASVCGPGVTPQSDSNLQKVSGWVSSTKIGMAGNTFRFTPEKKRFVDDYPSMNLIIKKKDFEKIKGFDSKYWPGEDTKLCLDITKKLNKKILYLPEVLVFHHRKPVFKNHLLQNGRYGLHRGYFAKILPETSFRFSYFIPSLFTLGFFFGPFFYFIEITIFFIYLAVTAFYLLIIIITSFYIFQKEKNILISLLFIPAIIFTHLWYGIQFIRGFFFTKKLIK